MLGRIGGGAYGEVWMARGATGVLRAVKIVWRRTFEDDRPFQREFEGIQRFEQVSREHPSQLALFHVGRDEAAGCFYYVMELADDASAEGAHARPSDTSSHPRDEEKSEKSPVLSGQTLGSFSYVPHTLRFDLHQRGRFAASEVIRIGLALTEALAHLHRHGLVHRDIKPSNIIFVEGRPKLADIGLVTEASDACSFVGTEGYVPPEGPGTPQADLFGLGMVLYEMSTGQDRRQFPNLPQELKDWPEREALLRLNQVVLKACARDPAQRYPTVEAMHADLLRVQRGKSLRARRCLELALRCARKALPVAVVVILAGMAVLALLRIPQKDSPQPTPAAPDTNSVFVLPFREAGPNPGSVDLCSRMTDAFIDALASIEGVRRSLRRSGWRDLDEDQVRPALAKSNDMRHILTGRIGSSNDTLTLMLRLYERNSDQPFWTETFTGKTNDLVALERRALGQLAARLRFTISVQDQRRIDQLLTNNLEALRWYREAVEVYTRKGGTHTGYTEVMELAQRALDLDPLYLDAEAYVAYMIRNLAQGRSPVETWPKVEQTMKAILDKDDTHTLALDQLSGCTLFYRRDWARAQALTTRLFETLPQQKRLWYQAFWSRIHGWREEAHSQQEQSEHPEPEDPDQRFFMASARWVEGRYAEGAQVARRTLQLHPGHAEGYFWLAHCLVANGDFDEGLSAVEKAQGDWKKQEMTALKGWAYAQMGQPQKARDILQELFEMDRTVNVQPYFVARVYAALGEKAKVLDWLERAEQQKSEYLLFADLGGLRTDLAWKNLQDEPRFKELLKKVGLDIWPRPKP
ncbi:MAG: protein kinase [Verrucomicrobiota bacterium]